MDPFAGTGMFIYQLAMHHQILLLGSLLVGSAHYGGYVLGTDINWILVHGRGTDCSIMFRLSWSHKATAILVTLCYL